jgi:hypothetical protein
VEKSLQETQMVLISLCVNVPAVADDAPDNYYNVYGIQSSTNNINSIVFHKNYIAADDIRFYGEISTPVAEPVASPIEEPVAVPVTEPAVAAPIEQPMAPEEPIAAPETQPEAVSPLVAAPDATSPSSRPNRNRVSAATSVIYGTVVISFMLLIL